MFADVLVGVPLNDRFTYRVPPGMTLSPGTRVRVDFRNRVVIAFVAELHGNTPSGFEVKEVLEVIDDAPLFDGRLLDLASFVAATYMATVGESMAMALPSGEKLPRKIKEDAIVAARRDFQLSQDQETVYREILAADERNERQHLIFGVTGSGKTEIYIKLAQRAVEQGNSVIYLVPEISISSQIYQRLHGVFGGDLVVYHSHLSPGERLLSWKKFYNGQARIAVGTRSAVFMQCPRLGLIVVDEEHDGSYKEQSSPRYNARRIALYRARMEQALAVFGSATPSIESLHAAERGLLLLHRLERRYGAATMPEIEIIQVPGNRPEEILSPRLKLYTRQAVDRGEQVIYLLNRRGFSPVLICGDCGRTASCPHCDISLTCHRGGVLECHYCGFRKAEPGACESCGKEDLVRLGSGTQRIEDIIEEQLPGMRVYRMDQDSMRKKGEVERFIGMMQRGEIDILVGTQMVAKGFDFPGVTLVGVLLADIGLHVPDFRATEKIFSLLMQVAGRSGRGERPGKVVVQTLSAENPLFSYFSRQDYHGFYRSERGMRRDMGYPPYSRMARLVLRGKDETKVADAAARLGRALAGSVRNAGSKVSILGPSSAPLSRIGGNYRYHLILKSSSLEELRRAIAPVRESAGAAGIYLEIDMDPLDIM